MKLPFWLNLNTLAAGIIGCLLLYIGLQKIELLTCRLHLKDSQHQLELISAKKNEQRETTKGNIAKAEDRKKAAEPIARRIETAPLPGNCKSPQEIMGADL